MSDKAGDGVGGERVFTAEEMDVLADSLEALYGSTPTLKVVRQAARQARVIKQMREWLAAGIRRERFDGDYHHALHAALDTFDRLMAEEETR